MFDSFKSIKGLSLKISFFASVFLLLFMTWITAFSFLYFFISEVTTITSETDALMDLSEENMMDTVLMKLEKTDYIDHDKLNFIIETNKVKEKTDITKILLPERVEENLEEEINKASAYKIVKKQIIDEHEEKQLLKESKNFELTRDSLIINRQWKYITNWIFSFEPFSIEELILMPAWIFTKYQNDKFFLFDKVSTNEYEMIFVKDLTYITDFVFKMFLTGCVSSLLFFILVFVLSSYLVSLFLKPINEYNTKLKEYNHNLAHEIKTPLTVVNMNLELLEDENNSEIVESNKEEIRKIKNITDSLLFLSENFTLKETQKIEINACIEDYVSKSRDKDKIFVSYSKKPIEVIANKNMFDRLIKNLCENAIKYSPDKISTIKIKDNAIYFINKVEKEITEKDLILMFETFYQLDYSRSNSGYWLWLTLVKRIVDIFKWDIIVTSKNKEFIVKIEF